MLRKETKRPLLSLPSPPRSFSLCGQVQTLFIETYRTQVLMRFRRYQPLKNSYAMHGLQRSSLFAKRLTWDNTDTRKLHVSAE